MAAATQKFDSRIIIPPAPLTQNTEAVRCLLTAMYGKEPTQMPQTIVLRRGENGMALTRSRKGDCYYVVSDHDCSCPARAYHPDQRCKHMKLLYPTEEEQAARAAEFDATMNECRQKQHVAEAERLKEVANEMPAKEA